MVVVFSWKLTEGVLSPERSCALHVNFNADMQANSVKPFQEIKLPPVHFEVKVNIMSKAHCTYEQPLNYM